MQQFEHELRMKQMENERRREEREQEMRMMTMLMGIPPNRTFQVSTGEYVSTSSAGSFYTY